MIRVAHPDPKARWDPLAPKESKAHKDPKVIPVVHRARKAQWGLKVQRAPKARPVR